MILTNVTIELSGIKCIVIDQEKVFSRIENNDWRYTKTGKIIPDHIMMRRIKKMAAENQDIFGTQVRCDATRARIYVNDNARLGFLKRYRLWVNGDTINIDRIIA